MGCRHLLVRCSCVCFPVLGWHVVESSEHCGLMAVLRVHSAHLRLKTWVLRVLPAPSLQFSREEFFSVPLSLRRSLLRSFPHCVSLPRRCQLPVPQEQFCPPASSAAPAAVSSRVVSELPLPWELSCLFRHGRWNFFEVVGGVFIFDYPVIFLSEFGLGSLDWYQIDFLCVCFFLTLLCRVLCLMRVTT